MALSDEDHNKLVAARTVLGPISVGECEWGWASLRAYEALDEIIEAEERNGRRLRLVLELEALTERVRSGELAPSVAPQELRRLADEWEPF